MVLDGDGGAFADTDDPDVFGADQPYRQVGHFGAERQSGEKTGGASAENDDRVYSLHDVGPSYDFKKTGGMGETPVPPAYFIVALLSDLISSYFRMRLNVACGLPSTSIYAEISRFKRGPSWRGQSSRSRPSMKRILRSSNPLK